MTNRPTPEQVAAVWEQITAATAELAAAMAALRRLIDAVNAVDYAQVEPPRKRKRKAPVIV